jgi:GTP-binding protein
LNLNGTPIRLEFKSGENPYAGKRNKLTPRQIQKRQRLKRFVTRKKS